MSARMIVAVVGGALVLVVLWEAFETLLDEMLAMSFGGRVRQTLMRKRLA